MNETKHQFDDIELPDPIELPLTETEIKDWMSQFISDLLDLSTDEFKTSDRFDSYGLDSVEAVVIAGVMEEEFKIVIDPALLLSYPSIDSFAAANCAKG